VNRQRIPDDSFEERLLTRLKAEVTKRGTSEEASAGGAAVTQARSRRPPHLALGAIAVIASLTALALSAGGNNTPAAFAVEAQPEGEVRVEIRSLEDAKGLEEALDEAEIPASVNYLATGMACKEPRFRLAPWPDGDRAIVTGPGSGTGPFVFSVGSGTVGPGQTLVITASGSLDAGAEVELAEGAVAPCEPVPAPSSNSAATGQGSTSGG
jgi:hypothetical protein